MNRMTLFALSVALCLTVLAPTAWAQATCPASTMPFFVMNNEADGCVIRHDAAVDGSYAIACSYYQSPGFASAKRYSVLHTLLNTKTLNTSLSWFHYAIDMVSLPNGGTELWMPTWQGAHTLNSHPFAQKRRFTKTFGSFEYENFIADPTASEYFSRWGQSVDVMPTTERVVSVMSLYQPYTPPNTCEPSGTHPEWRAVMNIFAPDGDTPIGAQNLEAGLCSFDPSHQGSAGWGEEMPDVSAFWYTGGDRYVVVWHDRPDTAIKARVFNASGTPLTSVITVDANADPLGNGGIVGPRVQAFSSGFVVVWTRTDQTLWMRTYTVNGTPNGAAQSVTPTGTPKSHAVDIHGTTFACPGQRSDPYFVVTWWAFYDQPGGIVNAQPQYRVFQNVASPVPLSPSIWYTALDVPYVMTNPSLQSGTLWDRVSTEFAPGCSSDLTIGFTYGLVDHDLGNYDEVRARFMKWTPQCGESAGAGEGASEAGGTCDGATCYTFTPIDDPNEPELLFPPPSEL